MKKKRFNIPVKPSDLINIQKLIFLIGEPDYERFRRHLIDQDARHCVRLIEIIRTQLPLFHPHAELCIAMYGDDEPSTRVRFNQLTASCFSMSEYLAINSPNYLIHNIQTIHHLLSEGDDESANFTALVLLDLAYKIDDFSTQILVLKFFTQEELQFNRPVKAEKYYEMLQTAIDYDRLASKLIYESRNSFNLFLLSNKKTPTEITKGIKHYMTYISHPSKLISRLGQYIVLYIIFYNDRSRIDTPEYTSIYDMFEKNISHYPFIICPYLVDFKSFYHYLNIGTSDFMLEEKEGVKEIGQFRKHISKVEYWRSYLNLPETHILTSKIGYYLNQYLYLLHRKDYLKLMPEKTWNDLMSLAQSFKANYDKYHSHEEYTKDIIKLKCYYAAALILLGGEYIDQGILEMEDLLFSYQQLNKTGIIDQSYLIMLVGEFSLGSYKKCQTIYKRYLKASNNKQIFAGNERFITAYLHISKWILNQKSEEVATISQMYKESSSDGTLYKLLLELITYFNIPINVSAPPKPPSKKTGYSRFA